MNLLTGASLLALAKSIYIVLCFLKVMKRGVRRNSTYLPNRKGDYDYLLWRRMAGFEVVEN